MVAAFHQVKEVRRLHFVPDVLEKLERTEGVARPLHEKNRRAEIAEHFVTKLARVAAAAKRITEADETGHLFFEGDMTSDPSTHAFADEKDRSALRSTRFRQRFAMSRDQRGKG